MAGTLLSLDELLSATGGRLLSSAADFSFGSVATDSRRVTAGSLFVPLIGEKQDGHSYIPQALEKGASVVLVSKQSYGRNPGFFAPFFTGKPSATFIGESQ